MPRKSTTGTTRKARASAAAPRHVPTVTSVTLPTRAPRHPDSGRTWAHVSGGVTDRDDWHDRVVAEAQRRHRDLCRAAPVPPGVAEAGLTDGKAPTVTRCSPLAPLWPETVTPPRPNDHPMPPEMQADARHVLDRIPAWPWYAGPDGVYAATGEYLMDTGGDGAVARDVARLPEYLDAALREAQDGGPALVLDAMEEATKDAQELAERVLEEAREKARGGGWHDGWKGGFDQGANVVHEAVGDATLAQRGVVEPAITALRDRVDALIAALKSRAAGTTVEAVAVALDDVQALADGLDTLVTTAREAFNAVDAASLEATKRAPEPDPVEDEEPPAKG